MLRAKNRTKIMKVVKSNNLLQKQAETNIFKIDNYFNITI